MFVDFVYRPIRDSRGQVTGEFAEGMDVTERRLADERPRLLINELNHGVKNSLATAQSVARQTLTNATDLKQPASPSTIDCSRWREPTTCARRRAGQVRTWRKR